MSEHVHHQMEAETITQCVSYTSILHAQHMNKCHTQVTYNRKFHCELCQMLIVANFTGPESFKTFITICSCP